MRIRKITLENLNSLVGEHELDLASDPIGGAGIFAITGPTGAGKSTLLDAITLALYGRAARYDRPNPEDMMSRHQGTCRAGVEFEVNGEVYRAEWSRRRARGKADGRMQPPSRFVYDAHGTVLTQGLGEADAKIVELCGLNYERFMRSVLLAQGEFARFLKAGENERAELLESLTGTAIFSELSELTFEEARRRASELEKLEAAHGAIAPLDEEARTAKEEAHAERQRELEALRKRRDDSATMLHRAEELARQTAAGAEVEAELERHAEAEKAFVPRREQLERHRKGEAHFAALARVDDLSASLRACQSECERARAEQEAATGRFERGVASASALLAGWIAEAERARDEAAEAGKRAAQRRRGAEAWLEKNRADAELNAKLPTLFESLAGLREQRTRCSAMQAKIVDLRRAAAADQRKAEGHEKARADLKAKLANATRERDAAGGRLGAVADRDEGERRVELERFDKLIALEAKLAASELEQRRAGEQVERLREHSAAIVQKREAAAELLDAHREHLETERLRASLEEHREDLKPGAQCPLCGSTEHPFAGDLKVGTRRAELEAKVNTARAALEAADADLRKHEREISDRQAKSDTARSQCDGLRTEVAASRTLLGLAPDESAEASRAARQRELAALEEARKEAQRCDKACTELARQVEAENAELRTARERITLYQRSIDAELETLRTAVRAGEAAQAKLEANLAQFSLQVPEPGREAQLKQALQQRSESFREQEDALAAAGDRIKDAANREREIGKTLDEYRELFGSLEVADGAQPQPLEISSARELTQYLAALDSKVSSANSAASECQRQHAAAQAELEQHQRALASALADTEFRDPDGLRAARLDRDSAAALEAEEKVLADTSATLKGRREAVHDHLERLRELRLPEGEALAEAKRAHQQLEERLDELAARAASLRAELTADDDNRLRRADAAAVLAEAREQSSVWQRLNGLIGSRDGGKFRKFAQGLSLDLLVEHANRHLARLCQRYQLARKPDEELGLEIVDLYQASALRPMSSLSGGESFLASLALALGLSDLAGRNVQIDSLFIDEGFGTLDGDTLDEAIAALEELRQRDKTVGVISHVELLKERVATQVRVALDASGRGHLEVIG